MVRLISCIVTFFTILGNIKCHRNNVCKTYEGYLSIDVSNDCFYNPDVFSDIPHLLERYVGNYENHTVTTEDGYILTMFRIPKKDPKGVVVLKHQLTADSGSWLATGNVSIAFLLSYEGYDVWLPNLRGTRYSKKHINETISPKEYWDFDFHEYGYYDYPAIHDYIKNETGSSELICIGHSASSTETLIYASMRPEHAEQSVKIFIEMAPSALFKNMESPVKHVSPLYTILESILESMEEYSILDNSLVPIIQRLLMLNPFKKIPVYVIAFISGWTPEQFDPVFIPNLIYLGLKPISARSIYHYAQLTFNDGEFRMYDYGKQRNMELYKSEKPTRYPLERIRVPIYMIYSTSDTLSDAKNAERLYRRLPPVARKYGKLKVSGLNHIDFVMGKDRYSLVVNPMMELVRKIANKIN